MTALALFLMAAAAPRLAEFKLTETPAQVLPLFAEQPHSADTRTERVLQFHGGTHNHGCDEAREWVFYFDKRENRLVSVTRQVERPVLLSSFAPKGAAAKTYLTPGGYPVLRVVLGGGRELVAAGARSLADRVSQVQLIRSADVARFYPELTPAR